MKFKLTSSCQTIKIPSLKIDRTYNIERAEKIRIKYGEAVLLTLQDSPLTSVKIFLPRRYGELFTEEDFQSINEKTVSRALIHRGTCPMSNAYILEIH